MFNPNEEYNCTPEIKCGGFTELMYFVSYFPEKLDKINELVTPDNINLKNDRGWTALMIASRNSNTTSSNNKTVELLLKKGADPNIQNNDGWTALMLASRYSNTDSNNKTVELLLKEGADPNLQNNDKLTALMMASYFSNTTSNNKTVELLLKEGADPNLQNNHKHTALMMAIRYSGNIETAELLLKNGANPNLRNNNRYTALMFASRYSNIKTVELLLKYGADPYEGIENCSTEECKKLVSKYIWKRIKSNIDLISIKYSKQTTISKDIWGLILLKNKQKQLCKNLSSNKNKFVLFEFAEMLLLPVNETTTKSELCKMISRQLSYGEPYSQRSVEFFKKKESIEYISAAAKKLGINTNQPINKILDDISILLG